MAAAGGKILFAEKESSAMPSLNQQKQQTTLLL
jgi:hypothetical protein